MSGALIPDNVHLKYIIFELNNNPAEIKAFLAFCAQLGISNVQYSLNFQELNGAGPSLKTLLGAAFFQFLATEMNMKCPHPSFLPNGNRPLPNCGQNTFPHDRDTWPGKVLY